MQIDIVGMLVTNVIFSIKIAPLVVVVATFLRTILLLTGKKREFEEWSRNPVLSVMTIIFAPGMVVHTAVRYVVCSLFRIDLDGVGGGSTYGELNMFLKVDRPPRVSVLVAALYVSTVLSLSLAFALIFLPALLLIEAPIALLSWYIALGVLFNSSLRGGDIQLLGAALKGRPKVGAIELVLSLTVLVLFYTQIAGLIA